MATTSSKLEPVLLSVGRYLWRIEESFTFLYNLFYIETTHWLLGNKFFLEEVLDFNWETHFLTYRLFRFLNTFVCLTDLSHGSVINKILGVLCQIGLDFSIIADIRSHIKTRKYFQRYSIFTIGLIPMNYTPWLVSYPIPTYTNSIKMQLAFIHLIFYIRNLTFINKHN